MNKKQDNAARALAHLHGDHIVCARCGEQTASSGSFKGYVHRWGPTTHIFIASERTEVQSCTS